MVTGTQEGSFQGYAGQPYPFRCDAIAQSVKTRLGVEVATAQVDADNVPELCSLIRQVKPDVVCNVALPYQDLHYGRLP